MSKSYKIGQFLKPEHNGQLWVEDILKYVIEELDKRLTSGPKCETSETITIDLPRREDHSKLTWFIHSDPKFRTLVSQCVADLFEEQVNVVFSDYGKQITIKMETTIADDIVIPPVQRMMKRPAVPGSLNISAILAVDIDPTTWDKDKEQTLHVFNDQLDQKLTFRNFAEVEKWVTDNRPDLGSMDIYKATVNGTPPYVILFTTPFIRNCVVESGCLGDYIPYTEFEFDQDYRDHKLKFD